MLRRELERRDLLVKPKVHISPSCGTEVQRLREYVRRLQGQLAESPGVLSTKHIHANHMCVWGGGAGRAREVGGGQERACARAGAGMHLENRGQEGAVRG